MKAPYKEMLRQFRLMSLDSSEGLLVLYAMEDLEEKNLMHAGLQHELNDFGFAWDLIDL